MFAFWNTTKVKSGASNTVLRPDPVFVIGMHRSGTSALAGALESLGLTVGKTVMPPHAGQGNPKGFYENLALTNLHDEFLKAIRSDWQQDEPVRHQRFSGRASRRFQKQLLPLLIEEFGAGRPLIKDPRLCRLIPLWRPFIEEHFRLAQFILPIRHPVEVACSLRKRDQMPPGQGLKLWALHVLESEKATRAYKRFFVSHEQLMQSPVETVDCLAQDLGWCPEAIAARVRDRIDPALRHHKEPAWPAGEPHEDLTLSIYQTLLSGGPAKEERLDWLRDEYYGHMGWSRRRTVRSPLASFALDSSLRRAQS